MRLSSRLSDKSKNHGEIESFIDWEKYTISPEESEDLQLISAGDFIDIQIGKITLPFYSTKCNDSVSFVSPKNLHCLIISEKMISIDCQLQCMDYDDSNQACKECSHCIQAWFLVGADDIFSATPNVYLIKQNFKLPANIKLPVETEDKFTEWLAKAEIAHKERLGAGSVIYLRSILEQITIKVGNDAGVDIYQPNGRTKPFNQVLQAVDAQCSIIPTIYSDNGYTNLPYIDKVLFVVDRKDLDYQTIKEYDRFEKGAANSNKSTAILQKQLEDSTSRIIVTTIQKLDVFIQKNPMHPIRDKHIVLVFDECHRSQFGDMHTRIVGGQIKKGEKVVKVHRYFRNYHIFGFTGTPIFSVNAGTGGNPNLKTTEQAFGDKLHTYTIVDAINDGNVLPFRIDYINTVKQKDGKQDKQVAAIDTEEALASQERISEVVKYILKHFDQKTMRNSYYSLKGQRVNGFNSMLAVSSIPVCKKYYLELKKQIAEQHRDLTIATIFSFAPNEADSADGILDDESFDTDGLDQNSRDFLDMAIDEYNKTFKTNFDTSSKGFQDYYKDLSDKVKKREVDLLIVVNMFLTGFDATTLNTLWVDKNLKMHGLIQAFSRTNRILNSVKTFGNIVCFRDLEKETNDAIALFGDKEANGIVLLKSYEDYYYGCVDDKGREQKGYEERIAELLQKYPLGQPIIGEQNKKDFIVLFGNILRLRNILSAFDRFAGNEILSPIDFQDYTGTYHDVYDEIKPKPGSKDSIMDDVVFEMELVKQVEVNIDYILMLVMKYHDGNCEDKEILVAIDKAIKSSLQLRSKKELIENFIATINTKTDVNADWQRFVKDQRETDIQALIDEEKLKPEETRKFVENAFRDGVLKTTGTDVDRLMPPVSRFGGGGSRDKKKQTVIEKLKAFFEKYFGLVNAGESFSEGSNK